MRHEHASAAAEIDTLGLLDTSLLTIAAAGIIGSIPLRGRMGRRAFLAGTAALVPLAYRLKSQEEAWHKQHPELRSSAPIH